jgi:hypothetical protein
MAGLMRLGELIQRLGSLDRRATIYAAEPWTGDSLATVALEPETAGLPEVATRDRLAYFLEVAIALDLLDGWESTLGRQPTEPERCARLIRYAIEDA